MPRKFCFYCGKKLEIRIKRDISRKKFCSRSCCTKHTKPHKGKKHSEETKMKIALSRIGKPQKNTSGSSHWNWKGGRTKERGYVYIYSPDHPRGGYKHIVREHTLIMEQYLKCYLSSDEVVHHINGIKYDNRLSNLELMTRSEHTKAHYKEGRLCHLAN